MGVSEKKKLLQSNLGLPRTRPRWYPPAVVRGLGASSSQSELFLAKKKTTNNAVVPPPNQINHLLYQYTHERWTAEAAARRSLG